MTVFIQPTLLLRHSGFLRFLPPVATLVTKSLNKHLELVSTSNQKIKVKSETECLKLVTPNERRPIALLLCWLMSKKKHVGKYAQIYLDQGFDVLNVRLTPWELLWPVSGSQIVAAEMLDFLRFNQQYQNVVVHGFSVGAYLWGEALLKMKEHPDYMSVGNRVVGQVFDSATDVHCTSVGVPKAVFQKNDMLRKSMEAYIRYHMKTFYNTATKYYYKSSEAFHDPVCKAPGLLFFSKTDPIGTAKSNFGVQKAWEAKGIDTYVHCWDKSPHVGHFQYHPDEYKADMVAFLDRIGLLRHPEKLKSAST